MVDFLNRKLRQKFMRHETRLKYYKSICARLFIDDFNKNAILLKVLKMEFLSQITTNNYNKKDILKSAKQYSPLKKGFFCESPQSSDYSWKRLVFISSIDRFWQTEKTWVLVTNRDVFTMIQNAVLRGCNLTSLRTANKIISTLVPIFNSSKKRVENCLKEQKLLAS